MQIGTPRHSPTVAASLAMHLPVRAQFGQDTQFVAHRPRQTLANRDRVQTPISLEISWREYARGQGARH